MSSSPATEAASESEGARERLLEAASRLFSSHSYAGATVRDIVSEAGTNLNSVNYYFGGKSGLYREVMLRELARARAFAAELPKAAESDPLEQRLQLLVLRILTFFVDEHSKLPRLVSLEVINPSDALDDVSPSMAEEESRELREIVAVALGARANHEAIDDAARSIYAQCAYFMFMANPLRRSGSTVFASQAAVRRLATFITVFSLGGLRALGAPVHHQGVLQ